MLLVNTVGELICLYSLRDLAAGVEKNFYPTGTGSGKAWLRLQHGVSGSGSVKRNFQCIIVNKKIYAPLILFKKGQFGHENHIYLQKVLGKKVLVFFFFTISP